MRKWTDQLTFDELLLANAEDNIERDSRNRAFIMRSNISVSLSRINFASSSFESWRV